eukprot:CAMPEP_0113949568 /NCGR_PEP_ID=MMETSP1339-20121228/76243_1 /TAXON_ID=94617 /ORGANISM="Fibrocapsa japonica" /LENGTH=60 /DNA_ID=CAMNT_0000957061 /DNA_START=712 /DNA_END=894 /DNA_ORIENTATION=- /assembly_acc=CAM_ASM_000762
MAASICQNDVPIFDLGEGFVGNDFASKRDALLNEDINHVTDMFFGITLSHIWGHLCDDLT